MLTCLVLHRGPREGPFMPDPVPHELKTAWQSLHLSFIQYAITVTYFTDRGEGVTLLLGRCNVVGR